MTFLKRNHPCGLCGYYPIADTETMTQHCFCKLNDSLPTWIKLDPYKKRQWLENYRVISENDYKQLFNLYECLGRDNFSFGTCFLAHNPYTLPPEEKS